MMLQLKKLIAGLLLLLPAAALAAGSITMHRDPGCPCCMKWAEQVQRAFGRRVQVLDDGKRAVLTKRSGIPASLGSCHTALVDGYVFEGHVPVADMKRFLAQKPKGFRGLAVAGMPMGSPGMESAAGHKQAFDVIAFGPAGKRVFARHAAGHAH